MVSKENVGSCNKITTSVSCFFFLGSGDILGLLVFLFMTCFVPVENSYLKTLLRLPQHVIPLVFIIPWLCSGQTQHRGSEAVVIQAELRVCGTKFTPSVWALTQAYPSGSPEGTRLLFCSAWWPRWRSEWASTRRISGWWSTTGPRRRWNPTTRKWGEPGATGCPLPATSCGLPQTSPATGTALGTALFSLPSTFCPGDLQFSSLWAGQNLSVSLLFYPLRGNA